MDDRLLQYASLAGAHGGFLVYAGFNLAALAAIWFACRALQLRDSPAIRKWLHAREPRWVAEAAGGLRDWEPVAKGATASNRDMDDLLASSRRWVKLRNRSALIGAALAAAALALSIWLPLASAGLVFVGLYMARGRWTPRIWFDHAGRKCWVVPGGPILHEALSVKTVSPERRAEQAWLLSTFRKQRRVILTTIALGFAWMPLSTYLVPWPTIVKWEGVASPSERLTRREAMALQRVYVASRFDGAGAAVDVDGNAAKMPGALDRVEELARSTYKDVSDVNETQESFDQRHAEVAAHGQGDRLSAIEAQCRNLVKIPPLPAADGLEVAPANTPSTVYSLGLPAANYVAGVLASQMSSAESPPGSSGAALVGLEVVDARTRVPAGGCVDVGTKSEPRVLFLMTNPKTGAVYGAERPIPLAFAREAGFVDGVAARNGGVAGGSDLASAKEARAKELAAKIDRFRKAPASAPKLVDGGKDWALIYQRLLRPEMP